MERGRGPVEVMLVGGDVRQLHPGPLNLGFRVRVHALEGRGSGIIASDSCKPRAFSVKAISEQKLFKFLFPDFI